MSDNLKLEKQLCFRLYNLSKTLNKLYAPLLKDLGLTYPQYLVMLVLWEHEKPLSVKAIGQTLALDSGTLSPLLKRMEALKLVERQRDKFDERLVNIELSLSGRNLKDRAKQIPEKLFALTGLSQEEMLNLQSSLDKLLKQTQLHL